MFLSFTLKKGNTFFIFLLDYNIIHNKLQTTFSNNT
jgi:hypothetical protein